MWQLYYFPLCPFSRKVRLALSEKGVSYELRRETPWDASEAFYSYNPAGRTPVLRLEEKNLTLVDSQAICEFFEETVDKSPLILGTAAGRAEIRRLTEDLTLPEGACGTWAALYAGLEEFINDFEEHMRLENDVLFPQFERGVAAND